MTDASVSTPPPAGTSPSVTSPAISTRPPAAARLRSLAVGLGLMAVGIAGLILPVLPGWLAIIAGVVVIAGVVPPLKRVVSRMVSSGPARRVIEGAAASRAGRLVIARAMRTREIRMGLTSSSRWSIVQLLLHRAQRRQL